MRKKRQTMEIPKFQELLNATLDALRALGGSGSTQEIVETVIQRLGLPDEVAQQLHGEGPQTELEYQLGWARSNLKICEWLSNSQRGVWVLTEEGSHQQSVDAIAVRRFVRDERRRNAGQTPIAPVDPDDHGVDNPVDQTPEEQGAEDENAWKGALLKVLQNMRPESFERLCQLLLRESGFIDVEVTGRSGDGGIDGRGIIRFAGLIGFPVLFQCKRYSGSVTPSQIRDFRGAMTGRTDRGLFITTGGFTREAQREATRDGAPPIDLIDGNMLVDKLKELKLGVTTRQVEEVDVNQNWFEII